MHTHACKKTLNAALRKVENTENNLRVLGVREVNTRLNTHTHMHTQTHTRSCCWLCLSSLYLYHLSLLSFSNTCLEFLNKRGKIKIHLINCSIFQSTHGIIHTCPRRQKKKMSILLLPKQSLKSALMTSSTKWDFSPLQTFPRDMPTFPSHHQAQKTTTILDKLKRSFFSSLPSEKWLYLGKKLWIWHEVNRVCARRDSR